MAPPKKPNKIKTDSKKFKKCKKKKKKNKNKSNRTVPVDNKAIDSEWWDIFLKKNTPDPAEFAKQRGLVEELCLPFSEEDVESASKAYVTSVSFHLPKLEDVQLGRAFAKIGSFR